MHMVLPTVAHGAPSPPRPAWGKHRDTAQWHWRQPVRFRRPSGCAASTPALKQLSHAAGAVHSPRRAARCSPSGARVPGAGEPSAINPSRGAGVNGSGPASDPKQQPAPPAAEWRQQKPQQLGPKPAPSGRNASDDRAADVPLARQPGPPARQATKQASQHPQPEGRGTSDASDGEAPRQSPSGGAVRPPRPAAAGTSLQGPPARRPARTLVMHLLPSFSTALDRDSPPCALAARELSSTVNRDPKPDLPTAAHESQAPGGCGVRQHMFGSVPRAAHASAVKPPQ